MVSLPFDLSDAPPAVRRPSMEVSFGSGSADDWGQSVIAVAVETNLAPSTDSAEIYLSAGSEAPDVAVGDEGSISFGYDDAPSVVFSGQVEAVRHSTGGITRITATNAGALLARLRVNQSYEDQKAGDIVNDLTSQAAVDTDTVEDGLDFPFHVIDDRRSAYEHIGVLALKSGYLAYITPDGALSFAPYAEGQPVQTFSYGGDILSITVSETTPSVGSVTTIGEGAAGSEGKEAWSWLIKDPESVTGSAGDGEPARRIDDSSLRSGDSAQNAADGVSSAASYAIINGRLLVPGAPAVVIGSTIEISGAPQDALNGTCLVRQVRHSYAKHRGFTSLIEFSKAGDGGLGGLL